MVGQGRGRARFGAEALLNASDDMSPLKFGGGRLGSPSNFRPKIGKVGWVRTFFDPPDSYVGQPGCRSPVND